MTSCCDRNIPLSQLLCPSSKSSCWQSPSAKPPPSGTTSADWHPSRSKEQKPEWKRKAVERRNRGEQGEELFSCAWIDPFEFFLSFFPTRNIALTDILICCIDVDDYDEEDIFWKHFIGWLTIRLENGLLETLSQTGRVASFLTYYFYTFNQAPTGTNTTTVLLRVSIGLLTVLPLWRHWLLTKLCHLFQLYYCFMIWQMPSVHSARWFVFVFVCSVSASEKKKGKCVCA